MLIPQTFLVELYHTSLWICADLCSRLPTLESHTHVYCGESLSGLLHVVQYQAADCTEEIEEKSVWTYQCKPYRYSFNNTVFYWPLKNKIAAWANGHEFSWWALKPTAKLCYLQCLSNSTAVIKRPKQVSPAHIPVPFPLPGGKACASSSHCTAFFLRFSMDITRRYQQ